MTNSKSHLSDNSTAALEILRRLVEGEELTPIELQALNAWKEQSTDREQLVADVTDTAFIKSSLVRFDRSGENQSANWQKFLLQMKADADYNTITSPAPTRNIHFLKTAWFRYAAILLLIAGAATYWYTTNQKPKSELVQQAVQPTDIQPGSNKAVLTLADGSTVSLDDAADGMIAQQGNARVVKLANGQISYDIQGGNNGELMMNTMSTPKGGQYQLVLPDGTKVWLNAASSITYPAVFANSRRSVKVNGEVYFEVAKNKTKPFVVDVDGKSVIEVLGTSFNVNSYANEGSIKTTLLEGSVKVLKADKSVIIQPGQQARVKADGIGVVSNIDTDQTLAWKNGLFYFKGADLPAVMRQLERWYDIEVQYKGALPDKVFEGKIYRNVNLSDVLRMLKKMDVKFELEGRNLIIL